MELVPFWAVILGHTPASPPIATAFLMRKRTPALVQNARPPAADAQRNQQAARQHFVEAATWISQDELAKAEACLDRHLQLAPGSWPGLCMKALLAEQTQRYALAESILPGLLQAKPDYAEGHCQRGRVCAATGRLDEALLHFERALQLNPALQSALHGMGAACQTLGRYADALALYEGMLRNTPDAPVTLFQLAELQRAQGDIGNAVATYRRVLRADQGHLQAASNLLFCEHYLPEVNAAQRLASARALGALFSASVKAATRSQCSLEPERSLRVGLVSADLRRHPVGYLLEPVLRHVHQHAWQWIAFSNQQQEDTLTAQLRPFFSEWHTVANWSDAALAQRIVDADIDILIDLSGHTAGHRLGVFAARPAPLQISWLGYFGSTGLAEMDYLLADAQSVPPAEFQNYTESVWRLPQSRFCCAPPAQAPAVSPLPALAGQPFTFGCFQELAKVNDTVLNAWLQILRAVPKSRLRIQSVRLGYTDVMQAFSERLLAAGFQPSQFQLYGPATYGQYLQTYGEVDMVLDTFPYPGGMTTVEGLWMGVPTLTLSLPGMLGRQGASLLAGAGLHEWICTSVDDYTRRAIALASPKPAQRQELADLRARLRSQLQSSPLLDAARFTADLYTALRQLWRQRCASP
ncbi:MAG: peptide-binding protein [Comamonadaceae bacterium PBBC2]|nr:MAG: peptide-binding protein [Comamonadaceae bacterium PBBC2]